MKRFLLRRIGSTLVVLLLVATLVFIITRVIPGDPAAVLLGSAATPEDAARLRTQFGLDSSLWVQYMGWISQLVRLEFGDSIFLGQSVLEALASRAELTASLTLFATGLAVVIGVPLGILAAVQRKGVVAQLASALGILGASVPSFWVGLILIQYFASKLGWFPVSGYGPPEADWLTRMHHLVLPACALALPNSALILRFTRTSMLEVLGEDYIRTARAKGLGPFTVVVKHAFKNALIPVLTVIGLTLAIMIAGAIVTETVFGLPGVGNLIVNAVLRRDYPVIQGALVIVSALYVLINLAIDLLYLWVDPRVKA